MSESKFYTIKEFAEILKVNEYTIWHWIKEDILDHIWRDGIGDVVIPESELERLVNGLESKNK